MKKSLIIALIAIFTAGPVLADGIYKSKPKAKAQSDKKCVACGIGHGLAWVVKLPFRLVTATTVGIYELITDRDLSGFEEGYYLI
jgi:hypothetical protein